MNFIKLKCVNQNVDLNDYLKLYTYVKENMQHPEWLGTFSMNEIEDILLPGGKIWLYYDNEHLVCSMFYIPSNQKVLNKRSNRRSYNWDVLNEMFKVYKIQMPKIYVSLFE